MLMLIAPERLCEDVLTHLYQHASVCSFCSSVQIFAVLLSSVHGSLQTTLQLANAHRCLHIRDLHSLIIYRYSRLEYKCVILGAHKSYKTYAVLWVITVRAVKFRLQRGTKTCVLKRIRFIAKRCG